MPTLVTAIKLHPGVLLNQAELDPIDDNFITVFKPIHVRSLLGGLYDCLEEVLLKVLQELVVIISNVWILGYGGLSS